MMKSKRLLCLGMAATLVCTGITGMTASAQETQMLEESMEAVGTAEGDYEYKELQDGTMEITGYIGSDTEIVIPSEISGKSVTSIGDNAFLGCSSLTSIELPSSVESIGSSAFSNCSSLTSIKLPSSVESIDIMAFLHCRSLTSITVEGDNPKYDSRENCNAIIETESNMLILGCKNTTIPNSVTSIGAYAFGGCSSLTNITIPNSVTRIGDDAFLCSSLTSIDIPDSVTSIGGYVFESCSSLTSIDIPSSVTSIGNSVFLGCSSLTSIMVEGDNPKYDSRENCNAIIETESNTLIFACKNTTIPSSVTSIGSDAFSHCGSLESIDIPSSVTSIGSTAFRGCSSLTSITVDDDNPKYDSRENCNAIIETESNTLIFACKNTIIPSSVTIIREYAFFNCNNLTSIDIPSSVTSIREYTFFNCSNLTSIDIPSSVTSIGDNSFSNCSNLTSIDIPSSVTNIGNSVFSGCSSVMSIDIPNSVTSIGEWAFQGCSSLTSVNIPESVTNIGEWAFVNCNNLTRIKIPSSVTSIGDNAFAGSLKLVIRGIEGSYAQTYALEKGIVFQIGDFPYQELEDGTLEITGYDGIDTEIMIPSEISGKSVTGIGGYAFYGCSSLARIKIPSSVTSIGFETFRGCSSLTSINIPSSVTSIRSEVFRDCSSLTSIDIPSSVTSIGEYAFQGCSSLTSVNISESVTSIGGGAFYGCSNLKDVYYAGSQEQWKKIMIDDYDNEPLLAAVIHYSSSGPGNTGTETSKKTAQSVTAADITKTYGENPFSLGAKSSGDGVLSYLVSDTKVATVDAGGNVTIRGCGITSITITVAETSTYSKAQKTITLTVKPKKATLSSVKSNKRKTATIKWKKDSTASGYIIECATDKKFKKNKVQKEITKAKTTTATIKKLKSGKKYYVRICAYVKSGNTKVQGDWSKTKTVKVKK